MGLSSIIAGAVATARRLTLSLQPSVTLYQWVGQDGFGKPEYADPLMLKAIVDYETRAIKTEAGQEASSSAFLAFLEPVTPATANAPYSRMNPIDNRDKIVLPSGNVGPILKVEGFVNGETGVPYYSQVWLGRSERSV